MSALIETATEIKNSLKEGETYLGAIIKADGTGHHIILLAGDIDDAEWQAAMDWAKSIGGDLPDRVEQTLMFRDHKDMFKMDWYWSNTQHASYASCAWDQSFRHGDQFSNRKSAELRARAVRRIIQ